jgi:hypothetical protein
LVFLFAGLILAIGIGGFSFTIFFSGEGVGPLFGRAGCTAFATIAAGLATENVEKSISRVLVSTGTNLQKEISRKIPVACTRKEMEYPQVWYLML